MPLGFWCLSCSKSKSWIYFFSVPWFRKAGRSSWLLNRRLRWNPHKCFPESLQFAYVLLLLLIKLILLPSPLLTQSTIFDSFLCPEIQKSMTIIMTFGATVMVESSWSLSRIPPVCLCFISVINKVNPSSYFPSPHWTIFDFFRLNYSEKHNDHRVASTVSISWIPPVYICFINSISIEYPTSYPHLSGLNHIW
jgi:hypothetical protein